MLLKDEAHVLRGVPLFAGMDPTKLKLLAFASDRVRFKQGQILFRQGDAPNGAFVLLSGEVEVLSGPPDAERSVGTAVARDVVGEVAILSDQLRDTTAIARSDVEALRITKDHFHKLLACCPGTMAEIIRVLGDRMARAS